MAKKLEVMAKTLRGAFVETVNAAFLAKFGIPIETRFDIFGDGQMISRRADEADFTPEQFNWLAAYSDGYAAAMTKVREAL